MFSLGHDILKFLLILLYHLTYLHLELLSALLHGLPITSADLRLHQPAITLTVEDLTWSICHSMISRLSQVGNLSEQNPVNGIVNTGYWLSYTLCNLCSSTSVFAAHFGDTMVVSTCNI